ncbi:hypothetical protein CDD82_5091 [Ophiocordyceps australis]|uniref:Uncharacterized protein n=1 Tax=Ophiocordyceps australis TaxID=1399860 RepID=A0A2C5YZD1_9HYPO|nr:hypothetical protein CDD82_5091 [Ophiocordyceps australis]
MRFSALCLASALELCAASTFVARHPAASRSLYPVANTSRPLDSSTSFTSSPTLDAAALLLPSSAATNGSTSALSWVPATSTPSTSFNQTANAQRHVAPTPASSSPSSSSDFATRANLTLTTPPQPLITPAPSQGLFLTVTVDCANSWNRTECRFAPSGNMTRIFRPMPPKTINADECTTMSDPERAATSISVVYTSTVTVWGNRSAYTPPYEPMILPNYCPTESFEPIDWNALLASDFYSKVMIHESYDHAMDRFTIPQPRMAFTFITTAKNPSVVYSEEPAPEYSPSWNSPGDKDGGAHKPALQEGENARAPPANKGNHKPMADSKHVDGSRPVDNGEPSSSNAKPGNNAKPVAKPKPVGNSNPVDNSKPVDRPSPVGNSKPVDRSRPVDSSKLIDNSKPADKPKAAPPDAAGQPLNQGKQDVGLVGPPGSHLNGGFGAAPDTDRHGVVAPPRPSFTIAARASQVAINGQTISDLGFGQTSVVNVQGSAFTIFPSSVVGQGSTLRKPAPGPTGVWISTPTAALVGGLPVTVRGRKAVIAGSTMDIPETATSTVIQGQPVALGPGSLVVGHESLAFQAVFPWRETHVMVKDAQLITASGRSVVVVHSTTYTYGLGIPATALVVGSDTVSIGPSGVSVHGRRLGGQTAGVGAMDFEAIGGNAITEIGPSLAVIDHTTLTVGPGSPQTTRVIAGSTYTLGPGGITASGWTLAYPFGQEIVTTFYPARSRQAALAVETAPAMDLGTPDGGQQGGASGGHGRAQGKKGSIKKGAAASLKAPVAFCIAMGVVCLF